MSARAFLRDLRHYGSHVLDQAALGVFQACAIAAEKVIDAYAPLEAREMERAAEQRAAIEQAAARANGCPGRGDGNDQQEGTESSSSALQPPPAGDQGSTESEWLGHDAPRVCPSPNPFDCLVCGFKCTADVSAASASAESSPGAVSDVPPSPAPGRPTSELLADAAIYLALFNSKPCDEEIDDLIPALLARARLLDSQDD